MARTFQDENFLTWEVFLSGGDHGFSNKPYLTFNCLTDRLKRPRQFQIEGDTADGQKLITSVSDQELMQMLGKAQPVD